MSAASSNVNLAACLWLSNVSLKMAVDSVDLDIQYDSSTQYI